MALKVSREEYEREVRELERLTSELERLRTEYDAKWERLRRTVANIRYHQRRLTELQTRLETLRAIGWARLRADERSEWLRLRDELIPETQRRIAFWTAERDRVIAEIYRELPEIRRLEEAIRTERARIRRKIVIVVPKPLKAVVDSKTGYLIQYLETEYHGHRCWLYDEKEDKYIEPVSAIKVEKTISLETPGHEDLIAEITAWTIISCRELPNINTITYELEERAIRWFKEEKFANVDKYGNIVISNFKRFIEDFDIQRRKEGAKYEMEIVEWYRTVTGEWAERPRIIKKGFGAYTTDEPPTYPTITIYAEYSHEEEPFPSHRQPPAGEEHI